VFNILLYLVSDCSNNEKLLDGQEGRLSVSSVHSSSTLTPRTAVQPIQPHDPDASNSNTSTLTEKVSSSPSALFACLKKTSITSRSAQEPSLSSLSSLDDKLRSGASAEDALVRNVLYSSRENVNLVHELFRQVTTFRQARLKLLRSRFKNCRAA